MVEEIEEWREVSGSNGLHKISSLGRVYIGAKEAIRVERSGKVIIQKYDEVIKVPRKTKALYPSIMVTINGGSKSLYVHQLVAEAFIGPRPSPKHHICHKDGDGWNPKASNLRYDTPTGNAADRKLHGTDAVGVNNPSAKYTEAEIREVKILLDFYSQKDVSIIRKMPFSTVRGIKQSANWSHVEI